MSWDDMKLKYEAAQAEAQHWQAEYRKVVKHDGQVIAKLHKRIQDLEAALDTPREKV